MSCQLNIDVIPVALPELVTREADVVIAVTSSDTPVLSGEWIVRPGLIIGAGATRPFKREFDEKLVEMAKLVVVDEKEQSKIEGGSLLWPISNGLLRWDQVQCLGDVVVGRISPPDFASGIILFLLHGPAILDMAIATRAYELAVEKGLGRTIDLDYASEH